MIKRCLVCGHTGELTWRDGEYRCAMCDNVVPEHQSQAQPATNTRVGNAVCPICKNRENNRFDGAKYHCTLCGTPFDLHQVISVPSYGPTSGVYASNTQKVQELKKEKNRNLVLGIVFIWLFWPASIYFFYKFYKQNKELKAFES